MPTCAACGHEVPEGSRFCNACGAPVEQAPAPREQRKTVTVLFCDVTGSTMLGERLDPESLRRVMASYFDAMRRVVESHGGTVEKFIGDAVMAVFGVPVLHEDDALRAVRAAAEMRDALADLNAELRTGYGTTLEARVGVNTGEVVTGTEERLATGDAVNVAARLEQAADPGEILLGEETLALVRGTVEVDPVEPLRLKGKSEPVVAYRLRSVTTETPARPLVTRLVGRRRELDRVRDAFAQAVDDRSCQLFTILGAAGVGKSRLAHEFLSKHPDATVLRGQCLSYGEGITYWPVVELLKQVEPRLGELAADEHVLGPLLTLLGERDAATSPEEIAWAVRKLLEALAGERPLVVLLDDLHWGEEPFLDLVEHVADLSRDAPILLLCMARPELLDRRAAWAGGKLNATTVLLEPLDDAETDELVDELLADTRVDDRLRGRIREAAEGNPFFVEQMIALLAEAPGEDVAVPPTIQALLAARLDQLDVAERTVLERGSVEGRVFHRGAVQALSPGEPEVAARLTSLVRKELVRPDRPQLRGEDAFRFRHLLIRDAAYDALPKQVRAELHEAFAGWLEHRGGDLVELDEILGYHLEQAYRYRTELAPADEPARLLAERARERLAAAGRRAQLRHDTTAARSLLERAVGLLPADGFDARLELDLADALWAAGRPGDAAAAARSLAGRAAAQGARAVELGARLAELKTLAFTDPEGRIGELEVLIESARPELERDGDPLALFELWDAVGLLSHNALRNEEKLVAAERAHEQAVRAGDERRARWLVPGLVNARVFGPTPVEDALAWIDQQLASGVEHPALRVHRAELLAAAGRHEEARQLIEAQIDRARELGGGFPLAMGQVFASEIEALAGDLAAAERLLRQACDAIERMGNLSHLSTMAGELAMLLLDLDRLEEAAEWVDRAAELGASDDVATQNLVRRGRARLLARRGAGREAEALAREALALAEKTDSPILRADTVLDLAEVLEAAGDEASAAEAVDTAIALYELKGNVVLAERARRRRAALASPEDGTRAPDRVRPEV